MKVFLIARFRKEVVNLYIGKWGVFTLLTYLSPIGVENVHRRRNCSWKNRKCLGRGRVGAVLFLKTDVRQLLKLALL